MADNYKILAQDVAASIEEANGDNQANIIYTVPANTQAAISSISLINSSETNEDYYLGVVKAQDVGSSVEKVNYSVNSPSFISLSESIVSYSYDGVDWLESTVSPKSGEWDSIAYGNGKFVAGGFSGGFAYSADGINWTNSASPSLGTVIFADNRFISVTIMSNLSYTSSDGITWTASASSVVSASIAYGDGNFVAAPFMSSGGYRSTDGITWTPITFPGWGNWRVAYGNGRFLTTDVYGSQIYSSTDGITWTFVSSGSSLQFLEYAGGKFIAGGTNFLQSSTDGLSWATDDSDLSGLWFSVAYGNGKFVAMAVNSNYAAYSSDSLSWTKVLVSTKSDRRLSIASGFSPKPEEAFNNTIGQSQTIIPARSIAPNAVDEISGGITLSAGDQIRVYSESPDLIVQVYGVEIS